MEDGCSVAGAIEAMRATRRGPSVKGPVYDWLFNNRTELAAFFKTTRPRWKALAAFIGSAGVRDMNGKPPTPQCVRSAWVRVEVAHDYE